MRGKLLGFALALVSVATIGVVQLQSEAKMPGQVGNTPRCTVVVPNGGAGHGITVKGRNAQVSFKVKGNKDCKVQVSTNAFYTQRLSGRPWNDQIVYQRKIRVLKAGSYTMNATLPIGNPAKGCFYQVDLSYGDHNILPVLAGQRGALDTGKCKKKPAPKPVAVCKNLSVNKLTRDSFRFTARADAKNGAKITGYLYTVRKDSKVVFTKQINTAKEIAAFVYKNVKPGDYKVRVTALTSLGKKNSTSCVKPISVKKTNTPTPGVSINKLVDGVDYKVVDTDVAYNYTVEVTNTGETTLKNVAVADKPQEGVTLLNADKGTITGNVWSYTIPSLAVDQSMTFTLSAKVPEYLAGRIDNTACVDAPSVPGKPDDCDNAEVQVRKPGETIVCNPKTGETMAVKDEDANKYEPVDSKECKETPTTPETPSTPAPKALPHTGPADAILKLIGAASVTGASSYYIASRRNG